MVFHLYLVGVVAFARLDAAYRAWDEAASARLEAQLATIRAAGEPLELAELAKLYPEPPPGENAAELYRAGLCLARERWGHAPQASIRLRTEALWQSIPPDRPLGEDLLRDVEAHLAHYKDVFELLDEATDKAGCRFVVDPAGWGGNLWHVHEGFFIVTPLYCLQALQRAERGLPGKAAESLCRALRARSCAGATPTAQTVYYFTSERGLIVSRIEDTVNRIVLPTPAQSAIQSELQRSVEPRRIYLCLAANRCLTLRTRRRDFIDRHRLDILKKLIRDRLWRHYPQAFLHYVAFACVPAYSKAAASAYIDTVNIGIKATRRPYPQDLIEGARIKRGPHDPTLSASGEIASRLPGLFKFVRNSRAKCDSARAALACLRYQAEKGKLPDTLDALVPDYIEAVPVDPYDAKPLRYRKTPKGFVVYAVGSNGTDDGGKAREGREELDVGFRVERARR